MTANISIDQRGNAQRDGKKPGQNYNNRGLLYSSLILSPNWKHHRDTTVDTDDDQDIDTTEHVDEHNAGEELAHEAAEDPVVHHHGGNVEREKSTEDKVRDCKAQVPDGVNRPLHLEARNPDDQCISKEAQQKNDHTNHQQRHTQDFIKTSCLVLKNLLPNWTVICFKVVIICIILRIIHVFHFKIPVSKK